MNITDLAGAGADFEKLVKHQSMKKNKWAFMSFDGAEEFSFGADLTLSLDVIYHLVEDEVYELYMRSLFKSSTKYVVIYSSNADFVPPAAHVRHRKFSQWIELNQLDFELVEMLENPHKSELLGTDPNKSFADFFIYKNINH